MLATTKKDFYVFVWPFFTCSFYWCNNMCILHVNLMNFHTLWHRAFQHIVYALFKHITVHSSLQNMSKSPHPETFCKNNSCGTAFTSPLKNTNKTQLVDIRTNSTAASGDNCVGSHVGICLDTKPRIAVVYTLKPEFIFIVYTLKPQIKQETNGKTPVPVITTATLMSVNHDAGKPTSIPVITAPVNANKKVIDLFENISNALLTHFQRIPQSVPIFPKFLNNLNSAHFVHIVCALYTHFMRILNARFCFCG